MKTYKELTEAYKPPKITGKTAHGHYRKSYAKSGYCDSCSNMSNGGDKPLSLYKFRWVDKEPVEGAEPEKHHGHFCSLRCHQEFSGDSYNEKRAGRSYVKPNQYD